MDKKLFEVFQERLKKSAYAFVFDLEYNEVEHNVKVTMPVMESVITAEKSLIEVEIANIKSQQELVSLSFGHGDRDYFFTYDETGIDRMIDQLDLVALVVGVIHNKTIDMEIKLNYIRNIVLANAVALSVFSQPELTLTAGELLNVTENSKEVSKHTPIGDNISEQEFLVYALKVAEVCNEYGSTKPENNILS